MGLLRAGSCSVDITPPVGTPMHGYGDRQGVSTWIHDPLFATALVLDDGQQVAAIVTMDWIGIDAEFTRQVRMLAAEATGIAPASILVACSHTHSGPALRDRHAGAYLDPALSEVTARKVAGALAMAAARRTAARWGVGRGRAPGIGTNRRSPGGPADDSVSVLRIDGTEGLLAAAYNFACHPTVLDYRNMLISADYPGSARSALAAVYGPSPAFLFLNGAAADISTRHLRRGSTFEEAARFGRALAGEVMRLLETTVTDSAAVIRVATAHVDMPVRSLPDQAGAEGLVAAAAAEVKRLQDAGLPAGLGALRTAEVNLQGARATLALVRQGAIAPVRAEFQVVALGDTAWFAVPGELFTEIGLAVKALAPDRQVQVVTYANDSIGYILTRAAYAEGGYEAGTARLAPEAEQTVVDTARGLLQQVGFLEG